MKKINRRQMLAASGGLLGASMFSGPLYEPETGCGGTICRLAAEGHVLVAVYLTRGEAGLRGVSHEEAAKIRSAEAEEACRVMNARPVFFGQIDGDTVINKDEYDKMAALIRDENPHMVLTQWPIDTHRDHRVAAMLVYDTWERFRRDESRAFDLYYYEVLTGNQTQNFQPAYYVDITAYAGQKKEASMKHACQNPQEWYPIHEKMAEFRGFEAPWGCRFAEAFNRQGLNRLM
jgi:LmbE family N-acetylglucosaminyl deacetylase